MIAPKAASSVPGVIGGGKMAVWSGRRSRHRHDLRRGAARQREQGQRAEQDARAQCASSGSMDSTSSSRSFQSGSLAKLHQYAPLPPRTFGPRSGSRSALASCAAG